MTDHGLTSEQQLLRDTAEQYFRRKYDFADRLKSLATETGFDPARWTDFAEMGWLGLWTPEEMGGLGGSAADVVLLMRSFGRHVAVEPYLSSVVLGGRALVNAGSERHCAELLPGLLEGANYLALAWLEPASDGGSSDVDTTAVRDAGGWVLNGRKGLVLGASFADRLIVLARTSGARSDREGLSLFVVSRETPGIAMRSYQTVDGRTAAEIALDNVRLAEDALCGSEGTALPALEKTLLQAQLALLGEALGAVDGAVEHAIDYLNTREQFGARLSTFQALRHRIADMVAAREEVAALVRRAVRVHDGEIDGDVAEEVAVAMAYMGTEGAGICKESIQLHGAIAITEEYIVGHYLKRVTAMDRLFGGHEAQLDRMLERFAPLVPDRVS